MIEFLDASEKYVAVRLFDGDFIIKLDIFLPEIYKSDGSRQTVYDYDVFIRSKTMNKHDYKDIVQLGIAFRDGYFKNNINNHLRKFLEYVVVETKDEIFKSALAGQYAEEYWIECTPAKKIESKLIEPLLKNGIKEALGYAVLSRYLSRIRKIISGNSKHKSFEAKLSVLGITDEETIYPDTSEIDDLLKHRVSEKILSCIKIDRDLSKILSDLDNK